MGQVKNLLTECEEFIKEGMANCGDVEATKNLFSFVSSRLQKAADQYKWTHARLTGITNGGACKFQECNIDGYPIPYKQGSIGTMYLRQHAAKALSEDKNTVPEYIEVAVRKAQR